MPMTKDEKICRACLYYLHVEETDGECRKSPTVVHKSDYDWCSEGWWKKFSDISGKVEDYELDDDGDLSYQEQKMVEKENKKYIVVSYKYDEVWCESINCEVFNNKSIAELYINDLEKVECKLFETYWCDSEEYWSTKEVTLQLSEVNNTSGNKGLPG